MENRGWEFYMTEMAGARKVVEPTRRATGPESEIESSRCYLDVHVLWIAWT